LRESLNEILVPLRAAITAKNLDEAGRWVCALFDREPRDWAAILTMEKLLPRAGAKDFMSGVALIGSAIKADAFDEGTRLPHFARFLGAAAIIHQHLLEILSRLEAAGKELPRDTIVHELSAFVEEQTALAARLVFEARRDSRTVDLKHFNAETLQTADGNAVSVETIHESLVEALQIVIAQLKSTSLGTKQLMPLAAVWRILSALYDDVVFQGWRSVEKDDFDFFHPDDFEEARRMRIGDLRRIDQLTTAALLQVHAADVEALNAVIASADANDASSLRRVMDADTVAHARESLVDAFLYGHLADELRVPGEVPWRVVSEVTRMLRALAMVMRHASTKGEPFAAARPQAIERATLVRLAMDVAGLEEKDANAAIAALTFDPKHRELELWDTPLIRMSGDRVLLVPSIVEYGSTVRQLENMASQWRSDLFEKRGEELERLLVAFFEHAAVPVQGSFKSFEVEFDVVVFWDGWLFLFEAKCTKSVADGRERYRARERAEEAVAQLQRRRAFVESQWEDFRHAAHRLPLPDEIPPPERIVCVAVLNIPHFSTWQVDGAIVTDEMCVQRFFSDPDIEALVDNQPVGIIGRIRENLTPDSFVAYLRQPPQVTAIAGALQNDMFVIPAAEGIKPIGVWMAAYRPGET
jgi:hypothetical protein